MRYVKPIAMWWGWCRYLPTALPKRRRILLKPNAAPSVFAITMCCLKWRPGIITSLAATSSYWRRGAWIQRIGRPTASKQQPYEPMTVIQNQISIDRPVADVYAFLADCNNHEQLMPDSIYDWVSTRDEARFTIRNMAKLALRVDRRTEN